MRTVMTGRRLLVLLAVVLITAVSCRPAEVEPAPDLAEATRQQIQSTQGPVQSVATEALAPQTIEATNVLEPAPDSMTSESQPSPSSQSEHIVSAEDRSPRYQVAFVEPDDMLNVRSGPGVENNIVGVLAPGMGDLMATGKSEEAAGSPWLPITDGDVAGWVNRRFLTEQMESEDFCRADEVSKLVDALREAVAARDGSLLAELVEPQGGLRLNRHWWNPTIYIAQEDVSQQFVTSENHHWGFADGTGDSIDGSFGDIILPLLDRNLLPANEFGCDEIVHGGTAGLIRLPAPYEGIHFISLHRAPDGDGFELDWGTWVAGIERRQGQYYVSYLVHYEWEI